MVTQFSLLGLHSLTSPVGNGQENCPTITGPWGWAHSTLAKNQSETSRVWGAGKAPADTQRTLALALLNCHLLTKVCGS